MDRAVLLVTFSVLIGAPVTSCGDDDAGDESSADAGSSDSGASEAMRDGAIEGGGGSGGTSGPGAIAGSSAPVAVDRVLINDDGALHFYCLPGGQGNNPKLPGNHNYFWYEAEAEDRFWLVPWDLDNALSESTLPPHIPVDWRRMPTEAECNIRMCRGVDGPPPGCDPVIRNFLAWRSQYEAKVDAFIAGPFRRSAVQAKLETWLAQITAAGFVANDAAVAELTAILDRARVNRGFAY